jgi:hypothetical protein
MKKSSTWYSSVTLHVSQNVGARLLPHGLNSTCSQADHASATTLMVAKTARCTATVRKVGRMIGYRRARLMTHGVASAHGSHVASSVPNSGSHAICLRSPKRRMSTA